MDSILTPQELEAMLGENLKALRLQKNLDQQTLCEQAGISKNALRHLEAGTGSTMKTLMRIIKALGRESWISSIAPLTSINPLHMVKEKPTRQRASRRSYGKKEKD